MEVSFNDTRCEDGKRVDPTDPLLFTCTITGVRSSRITVKFPTGHEIHLLNGNRIVEDLPDGVNVQNRSVEYAYDRGYREHNYKLTLSIVNTTLNGGLLCDSDETDAADGMAGCLVVGKFETAVLTPQLYSALCRMTCLLCSLTAKNELLF